MNALAPARSHALAVAPAHIINAMSDSVITNVRDLEDKLLTAPQTAIHTHHVIHAGMYARTIFVPADTVLTGVLIKIATLLIASGDFAIYVGDDAPIHESGNNVVIPAAAGRKQVVRTVTDTHFTMLFATGAQTVEDAECEFTDEYERLMSHSEPNTNTTIITGDNHVSRS